MFMLGNLIWDGATFALGFAFVLGGIIWDTFLRLF